MTSNSKRLACFDRLSGRTATIRGNPSTGKRAGELAWTSAPLLGPQRGCVKLFSGQGESLIDYN